MPADVTLTRPTHADGSSINAAVFNSETVLAASVPDATAASEGVVRLAGDLGGTGAVPRLASSLLSDWARNFLPSASADAARNVLGLKGASLLDVGTTAGTVCAGDDSRLGNSRKCNGTFDNAATARGNLGLTSTATKEIGTTPGTVCAGDDSRLSDSRKCNGTFDNVTAALAALGAVASNDGRLTNERPWDGSFDPDVPARPATARAALGMKGAALLDVGTTANTVCAGNDSRLSNSRRCNNSFDDVIVARFNLGVKSMALREVTISTAEPPASSGSEGDIWFQYTT